MSRQKGSRPRPVPDQRRYHEQFARPTRRAAAHNVATDEPISRRRRWGAALGATLVLVFAFAAVIVAIVEQDRDNSNTASTWAAVAAALVPVAFTILARASRTQHPFQSVLIASPLAVAGYLVVASLLGEPAAPLVLAFGVAGAFVLRAEPVHRLPLRFIAVGIATMVTLLLAVVAPGAAIVAAPFLAFPASVAADIYAEAKSGS